MHFLNTNLRELSDEHRIELSRDIVKLLDRWRVDGADQVTLLGLPAGTAPRSLRHSPTYLKPGPPSTFRRSPDI